MSRQTRMDYISAWFARILFLLCLVVVFFTSPCSSQDTRIELEYTIIEEISVNSFIINVKEKSKLEERYDPSQIDKFKFRFLAQPSLEVSITEMDGIIRTSGRIDRDILCPNRNLCSSVVDVVALIEKPMTFIEIIKVTIHIMDINDNQVK